ncbi:hypothetical protein DBR21_10935 [Caulobacter sp. HMWF009]|nr:hypothetical protein DBR21_10935 [Caulobacter sp. HMWF009]PTT08955.1 hypothetical protein DBR10_08190 [Caulobacter sp. HMWF025]
MSGFGVSTQADTIASSAPEKLSITLYRDGDGPFQALDEWQREEAREKGLILVTETRTMDLPAGRHTLRFDGVAEGLIPQSAAVEGLPGPAVERNYDYALLSPGTLIERSLGQPIKVVRTDRRTGHQKTADAVLIQGPSGLMVRTAEGVEALGCSGGPERLVLARAPDGLTDKPSLSTIVDVPEPMRAKLTVSYLALGVNWQADYVARIHPDGKRLDLSGWLTLVNSGGSQFANAPAQAVAGKLAREEVEVSRGEAKAISRACWPMDTTHVGKRLMTPPMIVPPPSPPDMMVMAPAPMARAEAEEIVITGARAKLAEQSDLGDYKLYTLPEPVTLNPRQTKQVAFLDQKNVAFQRLYVVGVNVWTPYQDDAAPQAPEVVLRLENKAANGLGKPLPSGALSAMETADGRPTFAGEQAVRDVPVGEPLDLVIGRAMDVRARPRLVELKAFKNNQVRSTYEVDLSNAKTVPATFEIRQDPSPAFFKVLSEPSRHDIRQGQVAWRVTLAPGETRTFRYRIQYVD